MDTVAKRPSMLNRRGALASGLASRVGLRARFLLIGFVAVLPLAFVLGHFAQQERDRALVAAFDRVEVLASVAAEREAQLLDRARLLLTLLADAPELQAGGEACNALLARHVELYPWLGALRLSDLDGSRTCADRPAAETPGAADRSDFGRILGGEAFAVSGLLVGGASGAPRINAAVPVRRGGRGVGVLSAGIELGIFGSLLRSGPNPEDGLVAWIVDRNGSLIARQPAIPALAGKMLGGRPVVRRALRREPGVAAVEGLDGVPRLFAFRDLPSIDATVAVGLDRASVLGPVERAARERLLLISGIFATLVLLGLLGGEFLILSPLRSLARTAGALENGDLGVRSDRHGVGEVGALSGAFDRMAGAVQEREEQLQEARRAAEHARRRAEHASHAKTDFIASMSHEIRTPLHGIIGYTERIMDGRLDSDQRRFAERIETATSALLTVVDEILDFSRVEAGQIGVSPHPFSLAAMIDNSVSIVRTFADQKGIPIRIRLDPELPDTVVGDEARLRQVLLNLLNNAVKFTAQGYVVLIVDRIASADGGETFRFCVTDTGIGIAQDKLDRLFKRFSQVHRAPASQYGGTGLGLAISKRLVELMGGTIELETRQGRGSTFRVEIRLPRADPAPLEAAPERARATPGRSARILIADDLAMNQEIATAILSAAGHRVDVVSDGTEAVEAVRNNLYDLVLMDALMGAMDGITATRLIRGLEPPARNVPIVAMTANVLPQQVRAFRQAGMNGHLGKPFSRDGLLTTVESHLSRAVPDEVTKGPVTPDDASFDAATFHQMRSLLGAERTAAWLASLKEQLEALLTDTLDPSPDREALARRAHALVSHAGSLGFTEISLLSRALEEACVGGRGFGEELRAARVAGAAALRTLDRLDHEPAELLHA